MKVKNMFIFLSHHLMDYGKLSNKNSEQLSSRFESRRFQNIKEIHLDFVLWKPSDR